MELKLIPTIQQDIELVPAAKLVSYVSSILQMHPSERVTERLIKSLKEWVYTLRTKKLGGLTLTKDSFNNDVLLRQITSTFEKERELTKLEMREYLKSVFINSYYTFNFVSSELGLECEVRETREKFLEVMSKAPYLLVSDERQPMGLNLYHRLRSEEPLEYEDYVVPAQMDLTKLIEHSAGPSYYDLAFRKQINTLAMEAVRESHSREKREDLDSQLNLLIAGFINPKMFGIKLEDFLENEVPKVYQKQADVNGDFEMPLPKCLA